LRPRSTRHSAPHPLGFLPKQADTSERPPQCQHITSSGPGRQPNEAALLQFGRSHHADNADFDTPSFFAISRYVAALCFVTVTTSRLNSSV
jgi:hypothetical protein